MQTLTKTIAAVLATFLIAAVLAAAVAQNYPSRPIRLIVPLMATGLPGLS